MKVCKQRPVARRWPGSGVVVAEREASWPDSAAACDHLILCSLWSSNPGVTYGQSNM